MGEILSMWMAKLGRQYRRYANKHAIHCVQRDLALTSREIAEKLEAKRVLQTELMNLRAERNSL